MKIKLVSIFSSLLLTACASDTCFHIVDKYNNPVKGVTLSYEVVRDLKYQKFETSRNYINKINLGSSGSEGGICFSPDQTSDLKERSLAFSWILEKGIHRKVINDEVLKNGVIIRFP